MKVVYWTGSGNTQAMAEAVAEGANGNAMLVSEISAKELQNEKAFALGCPAMGAEVLEEDEMEPFVCEVEAFAAGKTIGLFGSYGWGDGEWMREWVARMQAAGATVVNGEGVICADAPDESILEECKALGVILAAI